MGIETESLEFMENVILVFTNMSVGC